MKEMAKTVEYPDVFAAEFTAIREHLKSVAETKGLSFRVSQADRQEGFLEIKKGRHWVRVSVRKPSELDYAAEQAGAWGLAVSDSLGGREEHIARWEDGWKHRNLITKGWEEINPFNFLDARVAETN